mgnify:CR=1 FL=1
MLSSLFWTPYTEGLLNVIHYNHLYQRVLPFEAAAFDRAVHSLPLVHLLFIILPAFEILASWRPARLEKDGALFDFVTVFNIPAKLIRHGHSRLTAILKQYSSEKLVTELHLIFTVIADFGEQIFQKFY